MPNCRNIPDVEGICIDAGESVNFTELLYSVRNGTDGKQWTYFCHRD